MDQFSRGHPVYSKNSGEMLKVKLAPTVPLAPSRNDFEMPVRTEPRTSVRQTNEFSIYPSHGLIETIAHTLEVPVASPIKLTEDVKKETVNESKVIQYSSADEGIQSLHNLVFESRGAEESENETQKSITNNFLPASKPIQPEPELPSEIQIPQQSLNFISKGGEEPESLKIETLNSSHTVDESMVEQPDSLSDIYKKYIEEACRTPEETPIEESILPNDMPALKQDWFELSTTPVEPKLNESIGSEVVEQEIIPQKINATENAIQQEDRFDSDKLLPKEEEPVHSETAVTSEYIVTESSQKLTPDVQYKVCEDQVQIENKESLNNLNQEEFVSTEHNSHPPILDEQRNEFNGNHYPPEVFHNGYELSQHERNLIEENNQFFQDNENSEIPEPMRWSQIVSEHENPSPVERNVSTGSETARIIQDLNDFDSLRDDFEIIEGSDVEDQDQVPETM